MVEFDAFSEIRKPIDISNLLIEVELPTRLINILKVGTYYSEEDFFRRINQLLLEHTSHYLFPNRLIAFYPQVVERCANSDLICHLSGAKIKKGSLYYTYHPFMEDLESGRVYTIQKKIHTELGYIDYFPQNLFTYEDWCYQLKTAYYRSDNSIIDFYLLSTECGDNCLDPYLLGQSKKKRKK